jgi:primosomal protein N'
MYAEVALDVPVRGTFHYHIPPELAGQLEIGHLVQVAFRTAQQPAIVVDLPDSTDIPQTKPILALLDPRPVVTPEQIEIARWISQHNLMPLGSCLWLFLPPGLVGRRDIKVSLLVEDADKLTELEAQIVALLKRRGPLLGNQLNNALPGKDWRMAVDGLAKAGILHKANVLAPPRARPKLVRTAALAIHPDQIELVVRHLGRESKPADLLEVIAAAGEEGIEVERALHIAETTRATLKKLEEADLVATNQDERTNDEPLRVWLTIPPESVAENLITLRRGEKLHHILRVLARENGPMDVSWLYAQTDAKLSDLKRLEEEGLVLLGETESWRDSIAKRDFAPNLAPPLTPEQQAVWTVIEERIKAWGWKTEKTLDPSPMLGTPHPPPPSPTQRGGEEQFAMHSDDPLSIKTEQDSQENAPFSPLHQWRGGGGEVSLFGDSPPELWWKLKPLARQMRHEPTHAEDYLWQHIRNRQLADVKFRRQHGIERFIVDFFAPDFNLVIEVDGEIHQYTPEEDAVRQAFLESQGLHVLRFSNEQVLGDVEGVLEQIRLALQDPHPTSPAPQGRFAASERGESGAQPAPSPLTGQVGEGSNIFLLHGVTGSGKTEIYLRAIEQTLAQGRQALFLVPEIALTPQTIRRVAARFPGQVGVIHGSLSEGERYDTWRRAREGLLGVVVGARSALFTPFPDLGLIIMDEEHDHSYKQGAGTQHPYYHAREVAEQMMRQRDGLLLLGSATPDLETAFRAQRGDIHLLRLPNRIMGHQAHILEQSEREGVEARYYPARAEEAVTIDLPTVQVIDMRSELKAGNTAMFSRALQDALVTTLEYGQQAMLFLNRRGSNTYVFCRDCGYVERCPNCDLPLTYHIYDESLRCHQCGYRSAPAQICPNCQSRRIKYFGAGTQQVEQELGRLFPLARVLRWDADTARTPGAHETLLQQFIDRKADVLIGTQMVAKGLDLPLVTLVGVVSADVGLNLPDFHAGERTFQLLTQVAGRAGRGLLGGRAILQTYQPDHYVIEAAAAQDYARFYQQEIAYRHELGYPPFRRLARVVFQHAQEVRVRAEAERAAALINHRIALLNLTGTEMIGPTPCFFGKLDNVYRWHLILRSPDPTLALEGIDIPTSWQVDIDPVTVL